MNRIATAASEEPSYLGGEHSIKSWLLTKDHKRIAVLYLISVTLFFIVGGIAALLVRLELLTPAGDLLTADGYNRAFTVHGIVMIFFFLIPGIPAVLGNFLIPLMIGARDLAFPRINLLSWYLYIVGGLIAVITILLGGVDTGWTFYTPYSSVYANGAVVLTGLAAFVAGFSSILTGLNFIVTIHKMRAPGMTWFRLPLFVWAHYATSLIQMLATPVVALAILLVVIERAFGFGIFDPAVGGDPVLFQHLFWFYSHPAVYIMLLPGMGVMSELMAAFSRRRVFGYHIIAFSSLAIAALGFLVWGHHMFVSSQSPYAGLVFSILTMMVAAPSAIKVFNWTATLHKAEVRFDAPMLYALGFLGLFLIGGLTGVMLGTLGLDVHVHDTYFVVAHFHYVMVGAVVMAFLGGLHFWWPKMFGRMYPQLPARISAVLIFIGFNATFFPQFVVGYLGMPRRYWEYVPEFQIYHVMSTMGSFVLGVGYLLPLIYLLWSLRYGEKASENPWDAVGVEWLTPSPPTSHNFHETPTVVWEAYEHEMFPGSEVASGRPAAVPSHSRLAEAD